MNEDVLKFEQQLEILLALAEDTLERQKSILALRTKDSRRALSAARRERLAEIRDVLNQLIEEGERNDHTE